MCHITHNHSIYFGLDSCECVDLCSPPREQLFINYINPVLLAAISKTVPKLNTCKDVYCIYHTEVFLEESPSSLKADVLLGCRY